MATFDAVMQRFEACVQRLEHFETRLASSSPGQAKPAPTAAAAGPAQDSSAPQSASVKAFKAYYADHVEPFLGTCKRIGGDVEKIGNLAKRGLDFVGQAVSAASQCKKPDDAKLREFIEPLSKVVQEADASQDNRSKCYNHQAAFAEAVQGLLWIVAPSAPQGHVQTQLEASQFYLNKILTQFPEDDHKNFVKQIKSTLSEMKAYIKAHHTTGLEWNAKGKDLQSFQQAGSGSASASPPAPPAAAGCPPPPPPPAPAVAHPDPASGAAAAPALTGMAAVFAEINQGSGVTKGLNKVTADMKSKNRPASERSGLVTTNEKKGTQDAAAAKSSTKAAPVKKPPSITHNQGKWFVENFVDNPKVELPDGVLMTHTVYIYKCEGSTIHVSAKVKAICMDSCKKTGLLLSDVVSTVEVVNCQSVEVGMTGVAPSIAVDKTHGCQVILSQECLDKDPSIVTSNISEVNIRVPGPTSKSDPIELAVPEQFLTKLVGAAGNYKLQTNHVSHG